MRRGARLLTTVGHAVRQHAAAVPGTRVGDQFQLLIDGRPTTWTVVGLAQEREGGGSGVYTTTDGLAAAIGQPASIMPEILGGPVAA